MRYRWLGYRPGPPQWGFLVPAARRAGDEVSTQPVHTIGEHIADAKRDPDRDTCDDGVDGQEAEKRSEFDHGCGRYRVGKALVAHVTRGCERLLRPALLRRAICVRDGQVLRSRDVSPQAFRKKRSPCRPPSSRQPCRKYADPR